MDELRQVSEYWRIIVGAGWVLALIKFVPHLLRWLVVIANAEWERQKCQARNEILEREIANLIKDFVRVGGSASSASNMSHTIQNSTPLSSPSESPDENLP